MIPERMIHRTELQNWNSTCDSELHWLEDPEDLPSLPSLGTLLRVWLQGVFRHFHQRSANLVAVSEAE